MPITHTDSGTVFTGDSTAFYGLAVKLSAVKLEACGVRVRRRGPALWKVYRDHFGIPGTGTKKATEAQVIAWMEATVAEQKAQQVHIDKRTPPCSDTP
jgi:hypothetical protein